MAMAMTMPPPTVTVSPINLPRGIGYIVREAGTREKLGHVWPHMLRHSCGYPLANRTQVPDLRLIQDYLGHKKSKTPRVTPAPTPGSSRGCRANC